MPQPCDSHASALLQSCTSHAPAMQALLQPFSSHARGSSTTAPSQPPCSSDKKNRLTPPAVPQPCTSPATVMHQICNSHAPALLGPGKSRAPVMQELADTTAPSKPPCRLRQEEPPDSISHASAMRQSCLSPATIMHQPCTSHASLATAIL